MGTIVSRASGIIAAVFILLLIGLGGAAVYYHGKYSEQHNANQQLQKETNLQTAVIADQVFRFNQFNRIAANQLHYAVVLAGKQQEKEIEYRTILKFEPTCAIAVPASVSSRLLEYANSLRASAMRADPGIADSAGTGPTASGTLTYCQAVLWIDPLLTAIDKANIQLKGIRDIERTRQER